MTSNATHKHLFYTEMAKLLEAGFDIRKAAAVLMDTKLPAPQAALLKDLNHGLEAGQSITAAFAKDSESITDLERNIIGAGERGGKLAPAFQHLADYFGMVASARAEALKAMIYPAVILHLGILVGGLTKVMRGNQSTSEIVGGLIVTLVIFYVAAFVLGLAIATILKMAQHNAPLDRAINRIPGVGKFRTGISMARFCKVYHSGLLAGLTMSETAQLAAGASHSGSIREAGAAVVVDAKAGNALGPTFLAHSAFPVAFARSYSTGEEAGTLDADLGKWATLFQNEAEKSAKTLSVMIPKVLYFLILAYIAWQIIGFYGQHMDQIKEIAE